MVDPHFPKLRERRQFLSVEIYNQRQLFEVNARSPTEYSVMKDLQAEYNEIDVVIDAVERLIAVDLSLWDAVRAIERRHHQHQVDWFSSWQLLLIAAATILFVVLVGMEIWQWIH